MKYLKQLEHQFWSCSCIHNSPPSVHILAIVLIISNIYENKMIE